METEHGEGRLWTLDGCAYFMEQPYAWSHCSHRRTKEQDWQRQPEVHINSLSYCSVYTVVSRLLVPIAICSLHSITRHVINERHSSSFRIRNSFIMRFGRHHRECKVAI